MPRPSSGRPASISAAAGSVSLDPWYFLWASLLGPLAPSSEGCAAALDTLVHVVFSEGRTPVPESALAPALAACHYSPKHVLGFASGRSLMIGRPLQGEHAYKLSPGLQYSYVFNIRAPEALRGLLGNMGFKKDGDDDAVMTFSTEKIASENEFFSLKC